MSTITEGPTTLLTATISTWLLLLQAAQTEMAAIARAAVRERSLTVQS
jgi:hypothetical protein